MKAGDRKNTKKRHKRREWYDNCKECFTLTDQELCQICANPKRNHKQIMVVENTRDLAAYEKTGKYEGVYHVLHGPMPAKHNNL